MFHQLFLEANRRIIIVTKKRGNENKILKIGEILSISKPEFIPRKGAFLK